MRAEVHKFVPAWPERQIVQRTAAQIPSRIIVFSLSENLQKYNLK